LLKKGLLVNAVDPSIGGVLLRGEKGTGKTTAVRSFAAVLPPKEVVSGCRFGCVRGTLLCDECRAREGSGEVLRYESRAVEVVDLALNASEDRVVGAWTWRRRFGRGAGSSRWECWEGERERAVHRRGEPS